MATHLVRRLVLAGVLLATLLMHLDLPRADGALAPQPSPQADRLVIYVGANCGACDNLRENLLPQLWNQPAQPTISLQLIDIDALGTGGHALRSSLDQVPSFVFMQDGREVLRLPSDADSRILLRVMEQLRTASSDGPAARLRSPAHHTN